MRFIKPLILCLFFSIANCATKHNLPPLKIDRHDLAAKQRGAALFFNYCSGCHSLKHTRYDAIASGLKIVDQDGKIDKDLILKYLNSANDDYKGSVLTNMSADDAKAWFGKLPPDLSLESRVRGNAWIYHFLKSYYKDDTRPFGVNNLIYPNVGMPHALVNLQGLNEAILDEHGHVVGLKANPSQDVLAQERYDRQIMDLVNFLDYVSEPHKQDRHRIGVFVLLFLVIFSCFSYLYYKEVWKDVD